MALIICLLKVLGVLLDMVCILFQEMLEMPLLQVIRLAFWLGTMQLSIYHLYLLKLSCSNLILFVTFHKLNQAN